MEKCENYRSGGSRKSEDTKAEVIPINKYNIEEKHVEILKKLFPRWKKNWRRFNSMQRWNGNWELFNRNFKQIELSVKTTLKIILSLIIINRSIPIEEAWWLETASVLKEQIVVIALRNMAEGVLLFITKSIFSSSINLLKK